MVVRGSLSTIVLRQHGLMPMDEIKSYGLTELCPLLAKLDQFPAPYVPFRHPHRMPPRPQSEVALLHDLAGGSPERVAGGVAEVVVIE